MSPRKEKSGLERVSTRQLLRELRASIRRKVRQLEAKAAKSKRGKR